MGDVMTTGATAEDPMTQAVRLVLTMLPQDRLATQEEITFNANAIAMMQQAIGHSIDGESLRKAVEARVAVWQDSSVGLANNVNHIEWLEEARSNRSWDFWERYRRYLKDVQDLPPRVILRLDQATDRILRQIEDPQRDGIWRRTGLVVGQVQSGKTGNYIGLACKAADAGYRLIVILAGIHNSLRSQTQLRVDEGLLGFDTQYQQRSDEESGTSRIGVGILPGVQRLKIASLTNSSEKGDFGQKVAHSTSMPISDYPIVLVVKKHKDILEYVRRWAVEVEGELRPGTKEKIVRSVPLLIIDDEADHASVDTSKEDATEPPAINKAIRRLLASFERAAYVGYTATPFANIYMNPDGDHEIYGLDLFPESFIESLPAPSNYFGPERIFGLGASGDDDAGIEPLKIFREVDDHEVWMPPKNKAGKSWIPPDPMPPSLIRAINAFVLSCAARRVRGQETKHSSMLIHVTQYMDVQNHVRDQVDDYLSLMRDKLRDTMSDQARQTLDALKQLWDDDFVPTSADFPSDEAPHVSWNALLDQLRPAINKILVKSINGTSKDALEYYEKRHTGLSLIAVGGNKLSRGLTLEGLSVSFYLRASNTYDTLLQMGRWFGYRPRYEDLCRLYTTRGLYRAYREITAADNELRRDFEEMAALGETPETFGLKVRSSSAGLAVTAANKMRKGVKVRLSYSGDLAETTTFNLRPDVLRRNRATLDSFIRALDRDYNPTPVSGGLLWNGVSADEVRNGFLSGYVPDGRAIRVRPAFINEYIRRCVTMGELSNWSVLLVDVKAGPDSIQGEIGDRKVTLTTRSPHPDEIVDHRFTIRRVLSPADESKDLSEEQRTHALETLWANRKRIAKLKRKPEPAKPAVPTGPPLRAERSVDKALLIIYPMVNPEAKADPEKLVVGFAISFPNSEDPHETEYVVNTIWRNQEIDDLDEGTDQ
ncbi:Z1 domain-containing protein [Actinoplanes xinjiangensis]|uniref:Z1 domain-containing protein n=1 Tax=Actinoplanes xinjiangensis TaxID=512350 RepID=UPI0034482A23